ncbi:MAG: GTPase ObgE [Syntrophorhabdaceae bacterium]|jgi:GTP-binding protein|nr:GTPase ObgE [Syntrophorhabdaceae bacterium]MDD5243179.1 GTPase ObgE [Syntrophorhabdaceae bacterium]
MKFVDEAKIYVEAGKGGNGCVSFRRESFVPRGGPDGGDGGKGGDVIISGMSSLTSLMDFRYKRIYRAENGKHGSGKNKTGRNGRDINISVPLGTVIYGEDDTSLLCEITQDGESHVIVKGGRGGRGNSRFLSSTHRTPLEFDYGGEGQGRHLHLVLKLLADIGLVGLPNAGKSTLISCLTEAKPKIGDYPFTTLTPSLGVLQDGEITFVVADIPGIVEGASGGKGLGIGFLKHIERTGMLLIVLDTSSGSPDEDYRILLSELGSYKEELLRKKRVIALNKIDLISHNDYMGWEDYFMGKGERVLSVSALKGWGIDQLKSELVNRKLEVSDQGITIGSA